MISTIGHIGLPFISFEDLSGKVEFRPPFSNALGWGAAVNSAMQEGPVAHLKRSIQDQIGTRFDGLLINNGTGGAGYTESNLLYWLAWIANTHGMEAAEQRLREFASGDDVEALKVTCLIGATPRCGYELENGTKLVPVDHLPESWQKWELLANGPGLPPGFQSSANGALITPVKIPRFTDLNEPLESMESLRPLASYHHETALLLNAVGGVHCSTGLEYFYIDPMAQPVSFLSRSWGSVLHDVPGFRSCEINAEQVGMLRKLERGYRALPTSAQTRVQTILRRLAQAKRRSDVNDQILDLSIALEMLLIAQNTDQLSLTFRLRGAWLLGDSPSTRREIYAKFKQLYDNRSKVAHEGKIPDKNVQRVAEAMPEYIDLAERSVQQTIAHGFIADWDDRILGLRTMELGESTT